MSIHSWPLQTECIAYYGDPRGASGNRASPEWEAKNLVYVQAPWELRMGSIKLTRGIEVHRLVAESLRLILAEIWEVCGRDIDEIRRIGMDDCGGGYNYRVKRGLSSLSMHAFGAAVDFDPERNGLGDTTPAMDRRVIAIFEKYGWEWGGHWKRCDGMHFQAAWTRANPPRLGAAVPVSSIGQAVRMITGGRAPARMDYEVKALQERLQSLGYTEVGKPDGFMGSRTIAGISAFQAESGLPVTGKMDAETKAALATAEPRRIGEERASATAAELKAVNPVVKKALSVQTATKLAGGAAGLLGLSDMTNDPIGAAQAAADKANQAAGVYGQIERLASGAWDWAAGHPVVIVCLGAGVAFFVLHQVLGQTIEAAVERYRSGADTGV